MTPRSSARTIHPMTGALCSCGAPATDGALCAVCARQLTADLTALANPHRPTHVAAWETPTGQPTGGLADHLDQAVARQARIGDPDTRGGERPVPYSEPAAAAAAAVHRVLQPWAATVADTLRPPAQPPTPLCGHTTPGKACAPCRGAADRAHAARWATWRADQRTLARGQIADLATYLGAHTATAAALPDAARHAADLHHTVARATRVIDRPPDHLYAGPCGAEQPDGVLCDTHLYADPTAPTVTCPTCSTSWTVDDRRAWLLAEARHTLGTATELARALTRYDRPMSASLIHTWHSRGRLTPHGHNARGHPIYRLGDVLDLIHTDDRRADQRRQPTQRGA